MVNRRVVACLVAVGLVGAGGCDGGEPQAGHSALPTGSASASGWAYVRPSLPSDCDSVFALVDPSRAGELTLKANATPGGAERQSLYCGAWGRAASGKMTFNVRSQVAVLPPNPLDDTAEEVQRWARGAARGAVEGHCDAPATVVAGRGLYTLRCHHSFADGVEFVSYAVVGEQLRVASAEVDVDYQAPVTGEQARAQGEATVRAVVEAGLTAK